ncbi:MAG: DNA-processing protein DprA [Betaproteobacteria bacterium]|nr:DNA-processing protein DprA [Betaproteobacteria bacterium]
MPLTADPRDDAAAWLRLTCTEGIAPSAARALLAQIGLPQAVFDAGQARLAALVGNDLAQRLKAPPDEATQRRIDAALAWLDAGEGFLLTLADADYPKLLLELADPPLLLYARGRRALLALPAVAVVGSRNPTPQGEKTAEQFARTLAQAGVSIVSGLALGIDAAAHRGALAATGATIAVIGTGIDRIYPARNKELAHAVAERGLLLTEYAFGTPPLKENFPRRNRILSGLARGVLVVEAAVQSGSLITARLAGEQGREVMAIPGSIHNPQSRGCHALIKQGAKLVESAQDVLEELRLDAVAPVVAAASADASSADDESRDTPQGTPHESALLAALGYDAVDFDTLLARTGESAATLNAQLLELELQGGVARLPGGQFQRIGQS